MPKTIKYAEYDRAKRQVGNKLDTQLRAEIANAAARLVAEGEVEDFSSAKSKAADSLGLVSSGSMPDNVEVQTALIDYLRFYEGRIFDERLTTMRQAALRAMRFFDEFEPRLVGPVLYGSAVKHCAVTLHLYTDELESITRYLVEEQIPYELTETTLKVSKRETLEFPTFWVINDGLDFELIIFPWSYNIHPPLSALDGRRYKRADVKAVEELLRDSLDSNDDELTATAVRDFR